MCIFRILRQILQSLGPIIDVLILLFFVVSIFAVYGTYVFIHVTHKLSCINIDTGIIHLYVCIHDGPRHYNPQGNCINMYICIRQITSASIATHTCIHTYVPTYIRAYIIMYIHTYIYTYVHTYVHTYIHTYIHTYMYACIHTYVHTYIHTYIHTYSTALR